MHSWKTRSDISHFLLPSPSWWCYPEVTFSCWNVMGYCSGFGPNLMVNLAFDLKPELCLPTYSRWWHYFQAISCWGVTFGFTRGSLKMVLLELVPITVKKSLKSCRKYPFHLKCQFSANTGKLQSQAQNFVLSSWLTISWSLPQKFF